MVPRTFLSFVMYMLVLVIFVAVYMYTDTDEGIFLVSGIVGLVAAFVIQAIEISRGERYARAKIKVTRSDAARARKKP